MRYDAEREEKRWQEKKKDGTENRRNQDGM
jgi:hypothetical protein